MDLFVKTAKNTYYSGETVRIVGILTPPENGSILNFQVYGPNGIPVRYEQVTKSEDGCYYLYFRPENDSDVGEYVVELRQEMK